MDRINVRDALQETWRSVRLLPGERDGWVEVEDDGEVRWVALADVHPADLVALTFEREARQRYRWVPREDLEA
ncbi:MAG: hypothetical protein OHK0015_18780 [Chloroflexi bacterium OHK40]|jgi:hypothetical protein